MTLPNDDTPKPDDNAIDVDAIDVTDSDAVSEDMQDADIQEADVEYANAEILPPIKVERKKGLGFKSLLTATVFAGLLGAGGGFGLSYYLLPKLSPTPDTSRLETQISTLSQNNQAVSTKIDRLEQSVRDVSRQADVAGLTDRDGVDMREIETRLEALETQNVESAIESVDPSTFMYGDRLLRDILQEILENQIALQSAVQDNGVEAISEIKEKTLIASKTPLDSLDDLTSDSSDANSASTWPEDGSAPKTIKDDANSVVEDSSNMEESLNTGSEKTPAQSDTSKTDKPGSSDNRKASSSKSVIGSMTMDGKTTDTRTTNGQTTDKGAVAMNTKPSESVKSDVVPRADGTLDTGTPDYIKSRPDSNTTNGMNTDTINMGGTLETGQDSLITTQAEETISSENASENVMQSSTVVLPEFPEDALRAAVRENELAGKSWFARIIGQNLSIKKAGERDEIDDIVDLIARKDIAGALDKMETLPSSVRSVARDWMKAARQVR